MLGTDDDEFLSNDGKEQRNIVETSFLSAETLSRRDDIDCAIKLLIKFMSN